VGAALLIIVLQKAHCACEGSLELVLVELPPAVGLLQDDGEGTERKAAGRRALGRGAARLRGCAAVRLCGFQTAEGVCCDLRGRPVFCAFVRLLPAVNLCADNLILVRLRSCRYFNAHRPAG
jgi:hypothetical protein